MADLRIGGIDLRRRRLHRRERRLIGRRRRGFMRLLPLRRRRGRHRRWPRAWSRSSDARSPLFTRPRLRLRSRSASANARAGALDIGRGGRIVRRAGSRRRRAPAQLRRSDRDIGPGDREIGQRIVQARGDSVGIEAGEDLAGLDDRIFRDRDLAQLARSLRDHRHGHERPQGARRMHFGLDEAAIDGGDAIERMRLVLAQIGAPNAGEGRRRPQARARAAPNSPPMRVLGRNGDPYWRKDMATQVGGRPADNRELQDRDWRFLR